MGTFWDKSLCRSSICLTGIGIATPLTLIRPMTPSVWRSSMRSARGQIEARECVAREKRNIDGLTAIAPVVEFFEQAEGMSAGLCAEVEPLLFFQSGTGFESNTTVLLVG